MVHTLNSNSVENRFPVDHVSSCSPALEQCMHDFLAHSPDDRLEACQWIAKEIRRVDQEKLLLLNLEFRRVGSLPKKCALALFQGLSQLTHLQELNLHDSQLGEQGSESTEAMFRALAQLKQLRLLNQCFPRGAAHILSSSIPECKAGNFGMATL